MIRRNISIVTVLIALILMISVVSCDPSRKFEKKEKEEIQKYLSENSNLNFVKRPSGLYYYEKIAGTGLSPVLGDSAYINYAGMFLDGTVFDSNVKAGKPYGIIVGLSITGFSEGITLLKAGGKSTLLIPSKLGFGSNGSINGSIPGFTPLLYDIELVKVVPYTGN